MGNRTQIAGGVLGSILAACAVAAPVIINHEGWISQTYTDPVSIPTACAGVTKGVKAGATYTDAQCQQMTSQAIIEHGVAIAQCLPANLPTDTRAAFTSLSYNLGASAFCASSVARKARAGDLLGACQAIAAYVYAGGRKLPGLVSRRADEVALCRKGLKP